MVPGQGVLLPASPPRSVGVEPLLCAEHRAPGRTGPPPHILPPDAVGRDLSHPCVHLERGGFQNRGPYTARPCVTGTEPCTWEAHGARRV